MSAEAPKAGGNQADTRVEAFEKEYKESHPDGPYPPVEIKAKSKAI